MRPVCDPGGTRDLHLAGRRRHVDLRAQRRFPWRHRHVFVHVAPLDAVARVGLQLDFQEQVAVGAAVDAGMALPGQAQLLARQHALWNRDAERTLARDHPALRIALGRAQRDGALGAVVGVFAAGW